MTQTDRGIKELEKAGLFSKEQDFYGGMAGEAVKELLICFQNQQHSGMSGNLVADLFNRLVKGKPLSPLTDDPEEWVEVGANSWQNNRCGFVFRESLKSQPYTIEGYYFTDKSGSTFSGKHSRRYFDLPGYPPETIYIKEGSEEAKAFPGVFE